MTGGKKWRVERQREGCWAAYDPVYGYAVHPWTFDTHAEALAYADEQSRTITITLPPHTAEKTVHTQGRWFLAKAVEVQDYDAGRSWILQGGDEEECAECERDGIARVIVHDDQREAIALHLLAHHYRKARA